MNVVLIVVLLTACVVGQPCTLEARLEGTAGAPARGTLAFATYEWQADGEVQVHESYYKDQATVTFRRSGVHTVTLRVDGVWGKFDAALRVDVAPRRVYLPVVVR